MIFLIKVSEVLEECELGANGFDVALVDVLCVLDGAILRKALDLLHASGLLLDLLGRRSHAVILLLHREFLVPQRMAPIPALGHAALVERIHAALLQFLHPLILQLL